MNEKIYLIKIKKVFKDPIESYIVIRGSYGNVVFEINKDWIFRFSQSEIDIKQLCLEKAFIPLLQKSCSLSVPNIEYEGEDFIGYKKINGEPFSVDIFNTLSSIQKNKIYKLIGDFLTQFHSIKFLDKNLVAFPYSDDDFWKTLWKPIEFQLSKKARKNAYKYFTNYFKLASKSSIKTTICHADFHPNHLLYNSVTQNISGVIDFGRLSQNDPAIDFNLIERFYGNDALTEILKHYNCNNPVNFRERITFQNRRRLFAAIHIAKKVGSESELPRYIERIENAFS